MFQITSARLAPALLAKVRPELVDIITPPSAHLELINKALARGSNVICQKPFTRGLDQARTSIANAKQADLKIIVHENFRFQPWYRKIKNLIDQKALGRLYQVRFTLRPGDGRGANAYLDRQPYFQQMQRFLIHDTGIHFIDVFRFLCGGPEFVWSDLRLLNPAIKGEDAGTFVLGFADQLRAVFDGNRLCDHVADNHRLTMGEMLREGELAVLRLDGCGRLFIRDQHDNRETEIDYAWNDRNFGGDCVFHLQKHIVDHFATGIGFNNEAGEYLANMYIQQQVYASNDEGRRKKLRR